MIPERLSEEEILMKGEKGKSFKGTFAEFVSPGEGIPEPKRHIAPEDMGLPSSPTKKSVKAIESIRNRSSLKKSVDAFIDKIEKSKKGKIRPKPSPQAEYDRVYGNTRNIYPYATHDQIHNIADKRSKGVNLTENDWKWVKGRGNDPGSSSGISSKPWAFENKSLSKKS